MKYRKTVIAASAGALLLGGTVAYASIPDSDGTFHACVGNTSATLKPLYMLDKATSTCPSSYTEKTWGQTGPAGPAGPAGASDFYGLQEDKTSPANSGAATDLLCDSGDYAIGGGYHVDGSGMDVMTSEPYGIHNSTAANGWTVTVLNPTGTDVNFQTRVICVDNAPNH